MMYEILWKCYRCELTFRDEEHAEMHRRISRHSVSRIRTVAV